MSCIALREQAFHAFGIKADVVNKVVSLLIIGMQLVDATCLGLEPVVHITDKEYPTREELQVRISSQFGFELSVHNIPLRALAGPFSSLIEHSFPSSLQMET